MKIIAFGASNSSQSINKKFATHVASLFDENAEVLDLNDYPLPIYGIDLEKESGIPENAIAFYDKLHSAELVIISLAEHNGSYTAAFKSLFDWMSRHEGKTFADMHMLLLSTSPGGRGGMSVMQAARDRFPRHGANILAHFSLPKFGDNFDEDKGIVDESLRSTLQEIVEDVRTKLADPAFRTE